MVIIPLDPPEDLINLPCRLCGKPLVRVKHYFVYDRWLHATVHNRCADDWSAQDKAGPRKMHEVPERFRDFDPARANGEAARLCGAFSPQSKVKTLVIMGVPSKGKSRLLWATVQNFFEELGHGWPEAFLFETLMAEYDKPALTKIAQSKYVLVDDVGCVESYGRDRSGLQSALRSRIKDGRWTFLSIDNLDFDPGLEDIFKGRALVVTL